MNEEDEWFNQAADLAAASVGARQARARQKPVTIPPTPPPLIPRPNAAAEAATAFLVAQRAGRAVPLGSTAPPSALETNGTFLTPAERAAQIRRAAPGNLLMNADEALAIIVATIKREDDPFSAVGFWLSKITKALTEISAAKDSDDEE